MKRAITTLTACLFVAFALQPPRALAQSEPTPRQPTYTDTSDPEAVHWDGGTWAIVIGAGFAGCVAGIAAATAGTWQATDACKNASGTFDCYERNLGKTTVFGVLGGGMVGSALGVSMAGAAMGYEGDIGGALLGALGGGIFIVSGFGSPTIEFETGLAIGSAMAILMMPMVSTVGYYFSQDKPLRIGDTPTRAAIDYSPQQGVRLSVPQAVPTTIEGQWGMFVPLAEGTF